MNEDSLSFFMVAGAGLFSFVAFVVALQFYLG